MFRYVREQGTRWLLLLAACELAILIGTLVFATHLRYWNQPEELALYSDWLVLRAIVFGGVIVAAMAALGMYQPALREKWLGLLARQAMGFVMGGAAVALVFYVFPHLYVGRTIIGLALLLSFPQISAIRTLFYHLINVDVLKRRVLVLGAGRRAALVIHRMRRRVDRRGFIVVGFLPLPGENPVVPADMVLGDLESLREIVKRMQINEIVVSVEDSRGLLPMDKLLECKQEGIAITKLITFFEREQGKVKLNLIDPSWLIFSDGFDASPMRRISKRVFDMVFAATLLAVSWPLMLGTVLAIWIESGRRAPVLYRQERVGEHGKPFELIKFRSMRTDAEQDGIARWASVQDNRVTRVGRFIRKVRLDELPQLWNIMRGDMSLIGPRPERPQFVAELARKITYYDLRHCVKPGLAGWAQLNYPYGADEKDAAEKLKYDLYYVKNHDLILDVIILVQTFEVVLFRRGAR